MILGPGLALASGSHLALAGSGFGWLAFRISAGFGLILGLALVRFRPDLASGFHLLGFWLDFGLVWLDCKLKSLNFLKILISFIFNGIVNRILLGLC